MLSTVAASGCEAVRGVQLEARQFEHPDVGQRVVVDGFGQHVERGRADVAGDRDRLARALAQQAGQRVVVVLPFVPVIAMTFGA